MKSVIFLSFLLIVFAGDVPGQDVTLDCLNSEINQIVNANSRSIVSVISFLSEKTDKKVRQRVGTGFVVDENGLIVTGEDVTEEADSIVVVLGKGRRVNAEIVGHDAFLHIVLLKPDEREIPPLKMSMNKEPRMGDLVLVIGNTYGFQPFVSLGLVSGFDISIEAGIRRHNGLLQINTPVAPGTIGAAVFNTKGEVVGMLLASSPNHGTSFAVPSGRLHRSLRRMKVEQNPQNAYLGVVISDYTVTVLGSGVTILSVDHAGPGDKAGLVEGDLITSFAGTPVTSARQLQDLIAFAPVGTLADLSYVRNEKISTAAVILATAPPLYTSHRSSQTTEPTALDINELRKRLRNAENAIKKLEELRSVSSK